MSNRSRSFAPEVIKRDKCCQECGEQHGLQAHHIIPISDGGDDTLENGIALCRGCHADKHPDVPRNLFFAVASGDAIKAPYNAASMAARLDCCARTITRAAKRLGIERCGSQWAFSESDLERIKATVRPMSSIKEMVSAGLYIEPKLYEAVATFAQRHKWSWNKAATVLLEQGLEAQPSEVADLVTAAGDALRMLEHLVVGGQVDDEFNEPLRAALAPFAEVASE